jgi:hypothetical protein
MDSEGFTESEAQQDMTEVAGFQSSPKTKVTCQGARVES